ncbi:MutS-like protein [Tenacibaculum adriaticum]|uniref:MutS-like protein n=1 Tax=Tenacibaculum adriaticum TaxID=413713 RepID=A0A5S5DYG7_9FLAO|nr:DNA mismatch repair protein MutS [Tenacibaculum adriaticum]TYP99812.1 MutS-like protein [Tenacibaculum adriaticum]
MKETISFYKEQIKIHEKEISKLYKSMTALSMFRLLVFLSTSFGVYWFFNQWQIAVVIGLIGVSIFLFLLIKYTNIKQQQELAKALVNINEDEIKIASGDFQEREEGLQFQDSHHFYSLDIDLFGRGSFFQFMNRTIISEGTKKLVDELTANNTKDIISRQQAIKELASKTVWRQHFQAISSLIKTETPANKIIVWLKQHQSFLPKGMQWIPLVFSLLSSILFGLILLNVINTSFLVYWLLVGLAITGKYLKKINDLSQNTDKVKDTFRQYAQLLNQIENETFTSELLKEKQKKIQTENKKASLIFTELSKALDALDNRNNLISAIFGNGLFLVDIKNSYQVEQWIKNYHDKVEDWFEVVSFFDAYNSLGNYAYNHSQYIFPKIIENNVAINTKGLGHPLLKEAKRIDNDIHIDHQQFFIVTGANMAGKSTFLRTVSLHIVMANVGLPVCAESSIYSPVKLITSMRTSDSLTDDSSYFFSELKRLKLIVDAIQKEPYFIILDEILKGTNSTDKAIGSRKFVEKLVASKATGIIATHDLSLCEIEKELKAVQNYYFDAEIINDELHFDYTFKKGICQNMNASFLLKKMEII